MKHSIAHKNIDKEDQFNKWFNDFLEECLMAHGYIVQAEKHNKYIRSNVCEYSPSKSDCLICHYNSFYTSVAEGLDIQLPNCDDFEPYLWELTGETIKFKSDEIDEKGINECFYNSLLIFWAKERSSTKQ